LALYLHAAEMGLQESMRKFDVARLDRTSADFRGLHHDEKQKNDNDMLH
jgi:hypothetical protein